MRPPLLGKKTTQEFPLVGDVAEPDCGDGMCIGAMILTYHFKTTIISKSIASAVVVEVSILLSIFGIIGSHQRINRRLR